MTAFDKTRFKMDGDYLMYLGHESGDWHFIARFKYAKRDSAGFISFLIKNFTQEEYAVKHVVERMAPVAILETKGYISTTVKKSLKTMGYSPDLAGKTQYIKDQVSKYYNG